MRHAWLFAVLTLPSFGYELRGRTEPPAAVHVFLHGATAPFESSTETGANGRFRFNKLDAGAYTLVILTRARGEALQTIELGEGTVDSRGRLNVLVRIDAARLEKDGWRPAGATVSAAFLAIPESALREFAQAQRCLARREPDAAVAHLQRAVGLAPGFAGAWNQLGTVSYQSGRYGEAATDFRQALAADPDAFEPLVNLGGVLLNLGQPVTATGYNQRAVARRPNNALANSQLGLSYFQTGDFEAAEKYLKIAVGLDPAHFSHPQLVLADIYLRRGDVPAARAALHGFLAQHPDSALSDGIRRQISSLNSIQ